MGGRGGALVVQKGQKGKGVYVVQNDLTKWQDPEKPNIPAISEEAYLGEYSSPFADIVAGYDNGGVGGGGRRNQNTLKAVKNANQKHFDDYHAERQRRLAEYNKKISRGEIRKPTMLESAMRKAQSTLDELDSVQAARRLVAKKGYDWKTGKKMK